MPQRTNINDLTFDNYETTINGFLRNHQPNEMHIKNLGEFKVYIDDENETGNDKFLISTNNIPANYIHYVDTLVSNFAAEPNDIRYLPVSNPAGMRIFVLKKITALKEFIKKLVELGDNLDNDVTINGVPTDGGRRRRRYKKSRKSRKSRKSKKSRRRY